MRYWEDLTLIGLKVQSVDIYARKAWGGEHKDSVLELKNKDNPFSSNAETEAALQLYISTKDKPYADRFNELVWPALDSSGLRSQLSMQAAAKAIPYMDEGYRDILKPHVEKYKAGLDGLARKYPFGVPMENRGWGSNPIVINRVIANYYLNRVENEYVIDLGASYIFLANAAADLLQNR